MLIDTSLAMPKNHEDVFRSLEGRMRVPHAELLIVRVVGSLALKRILTPGCRSDGHFLRLPAFARGPK